MYGVECPPPTLLNIHNHTILVNVRFQYDFKGIEYFGYRRHDQIEYIGLIKI